MRERTHLGRADVSFGPGVPTGPVRRGFDGTAADIEGQAVEVKVVSTLREMQRHLPGVERAGTAGCELHGPS